MERISGNRWNAFGVSILLFVSACGGSSNSSESASTTGIDTKRITLSLDSRGVEHAFVVDSQRNVAGKIDYSVAVVVCNRAGTQINTALKIQHADATASVPQDSVAVGSSGLGHCGLGKSVAVVRLDDTQAFDASKLRYTLTSDLPLSTNPIAVTKVDLYRVAGRAGHEGLFALNSQYPIAGSNYLLRALLAADGLSARYELLAADGAVLSANPLSAGTGTTARIHQAQVTIPGQEFKVRVTALNPQGTSIQWVTDSYLPQAAAPELVFDSGAITSSNQVLTATVKAVAAQAGNLKLRLLLPSGFTSDWMEKTLAVKQGDVVSLPVSVRAPVDGVQSRTRVFLYSRQPSGYEALSSAKLVGVFR